MDAKPHWERIYQTFDPAQLSWYEEHPRLSLELIHNTGASKASQIIDVGGGTSRLVDELLAEGYQHVTVLDIVGRALELTRQRLRSRAAAVTWIEADITTVELPRHCYDVWHDRAVFHFLMQPEERRRYVETMHHAVRSGGHVIVATFTLEGPTRVGPTRCSGLNVVRYSPASLASELGAEFELVNSTNELYRTPLGVEQALLYCSFKKR
jgi:ubiquinone/menaquinone biosynthesis C-methylase UbiE